MADLLIKINGDIKDFKEKLEASKAATEDLSSAMESIAKSAAVAFAAVTAEIGLSIHEFGQAEAASRTLSLAIENQGLNVDRLSASYKAQAEELQSLTGIDDDRISHGQAILQGLIGQVEITQEMSKAAVDLSTQTGSLDSAFEILGRAIQGNTRGLKQFGIEIEDGLPKATRMDQVVSKLAQKFGDQATLANQGVGSVKGLTTAFGNFQEEIGSRFAPLFTIVVEKMTSFFEAAAQNRTLITWASGLLTVVGGLALVVGGLATAGTAVIAFQATIDALGLSLGVASGGLTLIAGVLVAAGFAVANYTGHALEAKNKTQDLSDKSEELRGKISALKQEISKDDGNNTGWIASRKQQLQGLESQLEILDRKLERAQQMDMSRAQAEGGPDPEKAKAARAAAQEEQDKFDIEQMNKKQELYDAQTQQLLAHNEHEKLATTQADIKYKDVQIKNETNFHKKKALVAEKANLEETERDQLLAKQKTQLQAETLATIATLSNSNNKTLATIGKAAGITQIAIDTPVAISKALAAFSPPFNFIAAGIVGVAMAAQAAAIAGVQLADGGIVMPTPGGTQATIGEAGQPEAVIPLDRASEFGLGGGGATTIEITLKDQLVEFIETRIIERRRLGISLV